MISRMHDFDDWFELIAWHIQSYPAMTARDVYKLLYQGMLGPEHSMPTTEIFRARLEAELAGLQADARQPLLEAIRPDGALQRIHLRPRLASGQTLDELVQACLETGKRKWGTPEELVHTWRWFLERVAQGAYPTISHAEAMAFEAVLQEHDYPAAHHSTSYEAAYQPAYRLVASDFRV